MRVRLIMRVHLIAWVRLIVHARLIIRVRWPQVVVDALAGNNFEQLTVGYCPCITHSRGKQGGYVILKKGWKCWTTVQDLARLQGSNLNFLSCDGVTSSQLGGMIGNAMSRNILDRVIPRLLYAAGCLDKLPFGSLAAP